MLGWILGFFGIGTVGVLVAGMLIKFGFLTWIPEVISQLILGAVELFFRLVSWVMTTFFVGNERIFAAWQAGFALCVYIVAAMLVGPEPLMAALNWRPWHTEVPAADTLADMPSPKPKKSGFDAAKSLKKYLPKLGVQSPRRDDGTSQILRHPLGT